ncbi:hypothetical protein ACBI99_44885 [Nonomuraea sp. ATR24]|uniref:hypothetical protein n=1 Tax=Nonomuraea sp. ATR24 TaxID=1676744 RepID=UPI0035BEF192
MTAQHPAIGLRVTATWRDGASGEPPSAGVLLPPAEPGGPLRLHLDDDTVITLAPAEWTITPVPATWPRCPIGRPLYRPGQIPHQLATEQGLRYRRHHLAAGQPPVATFKDTRGRRGNTTFPLYAVADAEPFAPRADHQITRVVQARTCSGCGARREHPYPLGLDGRSRYCTDCAAPAADAWWQAHRAADRALAAEWAHGVLGDPAALLVISTPTWPALLHATTPHGLTVASLALGESTTRQAPWQVDGQRLQVVDPVHAVPSVRALAGRRLIVWDTPLARVNRLMSDAGAADVRLSVAERDKFGPHLERWRAEPPPRHGTTYRRVWRWAAQQPPHDPFEQLAAMRDGLSEMAAHHAASDHEGAAR